MLVPFTRSPFKTKVEWEAYAALPIDERIAHCGVLSELMGMHVVDAARRDQSKMGGMSAEIAFLDVTLASGERLALVLKTAAGSPRRRAMGNAPRALR